MLFQLASLILHPYLLEAHHHWIFKPGSFQFLSGSIQFFCLALQIFLGTFVELKMVVLKLNPVLQPTLFF